MLVGPPDELLPGSRLTRGQRKTALSHHTDGLEAGQMFQRAKPKLAVFSRYNVEKAPHLLL
jgi:hypothetical protein